MSTRTRTPHRPESDAEAASHEDPLWYKDAVVYQLHVRSFRDSSGDGVGDFRGLVEKLDYLRVTAFHDAYLDERAASRSGC